MKRKCSLLALLCNNFEHYVSISSEKLNKEKCFSKTISEVLVTYAYCIDDSNKKTGIKNMLCCNKKIKFRVKEDVAEEVSLDG